MSNSTSILAYPDVKKIFDEALATEKGLQLEFKTYTEAFRFVGRANTYRKLDRKENMKIYLEPAHSLHGRSVYDALKIAISSNIVKIEPIVLSEVSVSAL